MENNQPGRFCPTPIMPPPAPSPAPTPPSVQLHQQQGVQYPVSSSPSPHAHSGYYAHHAHSAYPPPQQSQQQQHAYYQNYYQTPSHAQPPPQAAPQQPTAYSYQQQPWRGQFHQGYYPIQQQSAPEQQQVQYQQQQESYAPVQSHNTYQYVQHQSQQRIQVHHQQEIPQQQQVQVPTQHSQHALSNLSRFVNQQSPCPSPSPIPHPHSPTTPVPIGSPHYNIPQQQQGHIPQQHPPPAPSPYPQSQPHLSTITGNTMHTSNYSVNVPNTTPHAHSPPEMSSKVGGSMPLPLNNMNPNAKTMQSQTITNGVSNPHCNLNLPVTPISSSGSVVEQGQILPSDPYSHSTNPSSSSVSDHFGIFNGGGDGCSGSNSPTNSTSSSNRVLASPPPTPNPPPPPPHSSSATISSSSVSSTTTGGGASNNGHHLIPVRLQNMQSGARTKASMRKLMQEQQVTTPVSSGGEADTTTEESSNLLVKETKKGVTARSPSRSPKKGKKGAAAEETQESKLELPCPGDTASSEPQSKPLEIPEETHETLSPPPPATSPKQRKATQPKKPKSAMSKAKTTRRTGKKTKFTRKKMRSYMKIPILPTEEHETVALAIDVTNTVVEKKKGGKGKGPKKSFKETDVASASNSTEHEEMENASPPPKAPAAKAVKAKGQKRKMTGTKRKKGGFGVGKSKSSKSSLSARGKKKVIKEERVEMEEPPPEDVFTDILEEREIPSPTRSVRMRAAKESPKKSETESLPDRSRHSRARRASLSISYKEKSTSRSKSPVEVVSPTAVSKKSPPSPNKRSPKPDVKASPKRKENSPSPIRSPPQKADVIAREARKRETRASKERDEPVSVPEPLTTNAKGKKKGIVAVELAPEEPVPVATTTPKPKQQRKRKTKESEEATLGRVSSPRLAKEKSVTPTPVAKPAEEDGSGNPPPPRQKRKYVRKIKIPIQSESLPETNTETSGPVQVESNETIEIPKTAKPKGKGKKQNIPVVAPVADSIQIQPPQVDELVTLPSVVKKSAKISSPSRVGRQGKKRASTEKSATGKFKKLEVVLVPLQTPVVVSQTIAQPSSIGRNADLVATATFDTPTPTPSAGESTPASAAPLASGEPQRKKRKYVRKVPYVPKSKSARNSVDSAVVQSITAAHDNLSSTSTPLTSISLPISVSPVPVDKEGIQLEIRTELNSSGVAQGATVVSTPGEGGGIVPKKKPGKPRKPRGSLVKAKAGRGGTSESQTNATPASLEPLVTPPPHPKPRAKKSKPQQSKVKLEKEVEVAQILLGMQHCIDTPDSSTSTPGTTEQTPTASSSGLVVKPKRAYRRKSKSVEETETPVAVVTPVEKPKGRMSKSKKGIKSPVPTPTGVSFEMTTENASLGSTTTPLGSPSKTAQPIVSPDIIGPTGSSSSSKEQKSMVPKKPRTKNRPLAFLTQTILAVPQVNGSQNLSPSKEFPKKSPKSKAVKVTKTVIPPAPLTGESEPTSSNILAMQTTIAKVSPNLQFPIGPNLLEKKSKKKSLKVESSPMIPEVVPGAGLLPVPVEVPVKKAKRSYVRRKNLSTDSAPAAMTIATADIQPIEAVKTTNKKRKSIDVIAPDDNSAALNSVQSSNAENVITIPQPAKKRRLSSSPKAKGLFKKQKGPLVPTVTVKPSQFFAANGTAVVALGSDKEKDKAIVGPTLKVIKRKVEFFRGGEKEEVDTEASCPITKRGQTEFDPEVPWECIFCRLGPHAQKLGDLFGPYYRIGSGKSKSVAKVETWMHQDCALWAGNLVLIGSKLHNLEESITQSKKDTCTTCGDKGATIGCLKRGCKQAVHFPCAVRKSWKLDTETFNSFCPAHVE